MRSKKILRILDIAKVFRKQAQSLSRHNLSLIKQVEQELFENFDVRDIKLASVIYESREGLLKTRQELLQRQTQISKVLLERTNEEKKFGLLFNKIYKRERTLLDKKESKEIEERIILKSYEEE